MKYSNSLIIVFVHLFLLNCKKKPEIEEITSMNQIASGREYDSLYSKASQGNCNAFFELYIDMMEYQDKSPILKLSRKAFKKNKNCEPILSAYFNSLCRKYEIKDVYEIAGRDIRKMNDEDYSEAIECLKLMLKDGYITQNDYDKVIKK